MRSDRRTCFEILESALRARALVAEAEQLKQSLEYTDYASSELYGRVGAMVRRIYRGIPSGDRNALEPEFRVCEKAVRMAWREYSLTPN